MSDPGLGALVFLFALFFAVVGATVFVIAARRGVFNERPRDKDDPPSA